MVDSSTETEPLPQQGLWIHLWTPLLHLTWSRAGVLQKGLSNASAAARLLESVPPPFLHVAKPFFLQDRHVGVLQFLIYNSSGEILYSEEYGCKGRILCQGPHSILLSCVHLKNSLHSGEPIFLHLSNEKKISRSTQIPKYKCFSNCRSWHWWAMKSI